MKIWSHKQCNYVLDNNFGLIYDPFVKKDRLHMALSIVC